MFVKLHLYGVRGVVLKWLQNLFAGRTLETKIDSSLSDIADLISGVVQDSGVGPLMFLIYINELVSVLEQYNIKVKLFADDMEVQHLQFTLDDVVQWSDTWQLPISINICCLMNVDKTPVTQLLTSVDVLYLLLITPVIWVSLYQVTCLLLYMLPTVTFTPV